MNGNARDAVGYRLDGTFATLPRTTRGMPMVLGASPDGSKFLYCNGTSVVIRDVKNPAISDVYTEHSQPTTVAKYAPSGFYIASGDQSGKIRIWDTTQKEHMLKAEYPVISGAIRDITWSPDSKRIAVAGEGREKFGHVFLFDTGTSNGSLSGQSKSMNSIDFRPERPYRIVSASEDYTVAIFEGPPFKFKTAFHQHTRFAQCVRYKPKDGASFASCGADGKVFLFEGSEGELQGEFVDASLKGSVAHSGGIYGLAWTEDGTQLLTASGDKTCKLWDVATRQLISTFVMGTTVDDQQVGCLCVGGELLTVSLSGFVTYLDAANPTRPKRVLKGHSKPLTGVAVANNFIFVADSEGNTTRFDANSGETLRFDSKLHSAQIRGLSIAGDKLASVGWDDTVAVTGQLFGEKLDGRPQSLKLPSQPRGVSLCASGGVTVVACLRHVCVVVDGQRMSVAQGVPFEPTCIDVNPAGNLVAVGAMDCKARVYQLTGTDSLTLIKELTHNGAITDCKWSPDGKYLAVSDAARRIVPYSAADDFKNAADKEWTFHTAKVNCIAWNDNSRHLLSGALDTNLIVWDLHNSAEHPLIVKGAHAMSQITGVAWLGPNKAVSIGQDSNVKQWTLNI